MVGVIRIAWQGELRLCAWANGEQVGMLDMSVAESGVTVNMVFVKPPFRRRGIGGALLQTLLERHPQALIPGPVSRPPTLPAAPPVPAA